MMTTTIRYWQVRAAEIAESKGWGQPLCVAKASEAMQPDNADTNRVLAAIALIHSEASEATEAARVGDYIARYAADGSGKPEGVAVELADVVIRCMHLCELLGLDLERAVAMKMDYNATRTFRHGGKLA